MANLVLIGGRAVGKTTLSRILADKTGMPLFSTDNLIQFLAGGIPVSAIVAESGWESFRELERSVLEKLYNFDHCIIDCGGGVVTELDRGSSLFSEKNVTLLRSNGVVFWMDAPLEVQQKWLSTAERPSLTDSQTSQEELEKIMTERRPWYEQACDYRIQVNESGFGQIADQIISLYHSHDTVR